jgi:hypothetical protein
VTDRRGRRSISFQFHRPNDPEAKVAVQNSGTWEPGNPGTCRIRDMTEILNGQVVAGLSGWQAIILATIAFTVSALVRWSWHKVPHQPNRNP